MTVFQMFDVCYAMLLLWNMQLLIKQSKKITLIKKLIYDKKCVISRNPVQSNS